MISLASIVGGLIPFNVGNINSTFKTVVMSDSEGQPFPAVVKDLPARELFNELLAFLVLNELGLPVPKAYIGLVPVGDTQISKAPELPNGQKIVFVSAEIPSPSLKLTAGLDSAPSDSKINFCLERFVPILAKWGQLGELYAFDCWVANVDRNLGNILFGGVSPTGDTSVWLIDHGKSLTSDTWGSSDLIPDAVYLNKLKMWASPYLTDPQKNECMTSVGAFEGKARSFDKEAKIDYLAKMFGLSTAEKNAAKGFLQVRLDKVVKHSEDALLMGAML